MPTKEIALALARVRKTALKNKANVLQSAQMQRKDRELLIRTKWLSEIIKGWYLLVVPNVADGESSVWHANFWDFVRLYLDTRFGGNYCLSAENSIDLHTQNPIIPKQVIVICSKAGGLNELPSNTSIYTYVDHNISDMRWRCKIRGINCMTLPYALCRASPSFYKLNESDAKIALGMIHGAEEFSDVIIHYNFKSAAERILGAYKALNNKQMTDHIMYDLESAGWKISGTNPFETDQPILPPKVKTPDVARIYALWQDLRPQIVKLFPKEKKKIQSKTAYLHNIEELYEDDAYNSLSIEGYQVDDELIARVHNEQWNPDLITGDASRRNALAARGYYEAFLQVKESVLKLLNKENAGEVISSGLRKWYQSLFAPSVRVGIIPKQDVMRYRKHQVYIRNSRHVPLPCEVLLDSMDALFECLKNEPNAAVRAILGHYIFVYIHPYMDGNGRIGRFLMNAMFASGGYPWTIVHAKNRKQYLEALEAIDVDRNITPFAQFIQDEQSLTEVYLRDS